MKLTQRRVARVGRVSWHSESMVVVKQARAVKPRAEVRYREDRHSHASSSCPRVADCHASSVWGVAKERITSR
jgi:hypothetical protein